MNLQGTVVDLRPGLIAVDVWGDNERHDFKISPKTAFGRFDSLDDLTFGDKVNIYYEDKGKRDTALAIIREIPSKEIPIL